MIKNRNKVLAIILTICMMLSISMMTACDTVTRYSLVSGNLGIYDISNLYKYNYIEFNETKLTYHLENKTKENDVVTKQDGTYFVDASGNVTITNDNIPNKPYFLYSGETITLINGVLTVSGYISGYGNCQMVWSK